jgi:hypothetical protein
VEIAVVSAKHTKAFIYFLVDNKNKFCTKDRMLKWGFTGDVVRTFYLRTGYGVRETQEFMERSKQRKA